MLSFKMLEFELKSFEMCQLTLKLTYCLGRFSFLGGCIVEPPFMFHTNSDTLPLCHSVSTALFGDT